MSFWNGLSAWLTVDLLWGLGVSPMTPIRPGSVCSSWDFSRSAHLDANLANRKLTCMPLMNHGWKKTNDSKSDCDAVSYTDTPLLYMPSCLCWMIIVERISTDGLGRVSPRIHPHRALWVRGWVGVTVGNGDLVNLLLYLIELEQLSVRLSRPDIYSRSRTFLFPPLPPAAANIGTAHNHRH